MKEPKYPSLHQVKIYSIVTLILIMVGSGVSYWTAGRIDFYTNELMHTDKVVKRTGELYASILERETNIRGYVITKDQDFLSYYNQSNIDAKLLIDELQVLTIDNAQQQRNIEQLRNLVEERIRSFEATVSYLDTHGSLEGFVGPTRTNVELTGYKLIKNIVFDINQVENKLFIQRNKRLVNNINALPFIVGLISLFSVTIGLMTLFSVYQYNKAQKNSYLEISDVQKKLREKIQLLDDLNVELEQFAYVASHDLQEPLRKITAFSDLLNLQYYDKLEGDGLLYLNRITAAAVRMRQLITDLLEYSRAGKIDLDAIRPVMLNKVIAELLEDIEIAIQDKSAQVQVDPLGKVLGSDTEFRQVFQNLIANALKFSKPAVSSIITITSCDAEESIVKNFTFLDQSLSYYHIQVIDNGIGFGNEHAEKIFSVFQRLHGKKEFEGTGIGLAITRKIIEKYQGWIYAESVTGNGATFHIILPKITE
jgi:signal transduction histidine kinase